MDVEEIIDELYRLRPEEFIAARDARVADARKAKDPAAAGRLARLRRPTLAAWASNLFVRERPGEVERLLALGKTLREAHRTLDAGQLRQASRQQHQMITLLARETAVLAQEAGLALSEAVRHEIEQILHRVLADPQVAEEWAAGRLAKAPEATVDFTAVTPVALPERARPPAETPSAPVEGRKATAKAGAKRANRQEAARREKVARARTAAGEAAAEARRRQAVHDEVEEAQRAADARVGRAEQRVAELEEHLRQAHEEQQEARSAAAAAKSAADQAASAVKSARRTADRTARALAKLIGDHDVE